MLGRHGIFRLRHCSIIYPTCDIRRRDNSREILRQICVHGDTPFFLSGHRRRAGKKPAVFSVVCFAYPAKQRHHHHHQQQQQHIRESTTNCDYTVDSLEPRPSSPAVIRCRRSYSWVWSVQSAVKICTASVLTSSVTVQRRPRTGVGTMKLNRWVSNIEKENWQPSTLHNSFHDKPCPDSSRCHLVQEPYHPPTKTSPNYLEHT